MNTAFLPGRVFPQLARSEAYSFGRIIGDIHGLKAVM